MTRKHILTEAQEQVMRCVVQGMRTPQIAEALAVSHYTVKQHFVDIREVLGTKTIAQSVYIWMMAEAIRLVEKGYERHEYDLYVRRVHDQLKQESKRYNRGH